MLCENMELWACVPKLVWHGEAPQHQPWMYLPVSPAPGQPVSVGMAPATRQGFLGLEMEILAAGCAQMS